MKTQLDIGPRFDPACADAHMGLWLYEPARFAAASAAVLSGQSPGLAQPEADVERVLYTVGANGLAVISIRGPIMKADSKFGGTNSVRTRRAVRTASADADVRGILLLIDSPGGSVSGTEELANDVAAADKIKPVVAHIDDLGASAALWVASQARWITANESALVGSIGTTGTVIDSSGAAEAAGIKVYAISSKGAEEFKGAGAPGTPISEKQLAYFQGLADATQELFTAAVAQGRGMSVADVRALADGRVHLAREALRLGLIDAVASSDAAVAAAEDAMGEVAPVGGGRFSRQRAENRMRLRANTQTPRMG
tara:strand:+ start:938 stop:1873 length:936 start_codon:yes stop_codon:yes gene_type:complete